MPNNLIRKPYDSELEYFKQNPNVSGMAAEDDKVILNPYSKLSKKELDAVALNETARIAMRKNPELQPNFELTDEQKNMLSTGSYADADETHRKATVAARILSGDPSAGTPTEEQLQFVDKLRSSMPGEDKPTKMAKGGQVKAQTKRLLAEGGLKHEGGTKDPVSGNNVPIGATQEEVRDDIPAQLSEGEFVFPADVVRYIGLERLMMMRQAAKQGLMKMEDMGQMSNGDEGSEEEDTGEFESEIDEIVGVMEEVDGKRKMAEGGMPMPAAATPTAPSPSMEAQKPAIEGLPEKEIIAESMTKDNYTPMEQKAVNTFLASPVLKDAITLRNNDTLFMVLGAEPGVVTAHTFSMDDPEVLKDSVGKFIGSLKQANVKQVRGETKNPALMTSYEENGVTPKTTEQNGVISYTIDIPQESAAATQTPAALGTPPALPEPPMPTEPVAQPQPSV